MAKQERHGAKLAQRLEFGKEKVGIGRDHVKGCVPPNLQLPLLQIKCIWKDFGERLKPIYALCPGTEHLWHR